MSNREKEPEDDIRFDLLVDDELNEEDRRKLLASLDKRPDGWRNCALAFLETQSWEKEFGAIVRQSTTQDPVEQGSPEQEPAAAVSPRRPGGWLRSVRFSGTIAAMAASFLIALLVSRHLKEAWRPDAPSPPDNLVATNEDPTPAMEHPESAPMLQTPDSPSSPWQMVSLSTPEKSQDSIEFPARERNRLDPNWMTNLPKAMPDDIRRALERTGHHVQQRRELHPIEMEDGRQLVVPVDQVDVHYVGNPNL